MARKLYSPRLGSLLCLRTSGCQLRMLGPLTLLQLINLNLFFKKKKKINKTIAALQTVLVSVVQQHKSAIRSDQIRSVAQSCPTLCDPMNCSTPGLPIHHQLPEFTETHVYQVSDAIQPSHPLSSPSPPAPNPSQHQRFFQ